MEQSPFDYLGLIIIGRQAYKTETLYFRGPYVEISPAERSTINIVHLIFFRVIIFFIQVQFFVEHWVISLLTSGSCLIFSFLEDGFG